MFIFDCKIEELFMKCIKTLITAAATATSISAFAAGSDFSRYEDLANAKLNGGYPTEEAQTQLRDESYFQRASMVFQWALPIVNMRAMKEGHARMMKGTAYNKISVYQDRLKAHTLITTPNSDVIYGLAWLDMKDTGPLVVEHPKGLQSLMDDMYHHPLYGPDSKDLPGGRYMGDIGNAGPDKGKGGKFLLLPPNKKRADYAKLADKYFIYESNTSEVFLFLRAFFKDMNNTQPAVDLMKTLKVYPLEGKAKKMEFFDVSDIESKSIWDNDYSYFEMLDRAVQNMELATFDPYMNGLMNEIGIKKGVKFNPTAREKELLDLAAKSSWKISKEIALNFDQKSRKTVGDTWFWQDRPTWIAHGLTNAGEQYNAVSDPHYQNWDTGYVNVNAHLHMWTNHYSMSTAMLSAKEGAGAKYTGAYKDSDGKPLTGKCNYSVRLPKGIPAGLFWSLTAYDAVTAAGVDVKNNKWPSLGDRDNPVTNKDGSTTIYMGPTAPKDSKMAESNWLQFSDESWFTLLRLYGPTKGIFDGSWRPDEFKRLSCVK